MWITSTHYSAERQETTERKAERLARAERQRRGWKGKKKNLPLLFEKG